MYCLEDPRITVKIAKELGYCIGCEGCEAEEEESEAN
jgi:hypothetical protein